MGRQLPAIGLAQPLQLTTAQLDAVSPLALLPAEPVVAKPQQRQLPGLLASLQPELETELTAQAAGSPLDQLGQGRVILLLAGEVKLTVQPFWPVRRPLQIDNQPQAVADRLMGQGGGT